MNAFPSNSRLLGLQPYNRKFNRYGLPTIPVFYYICDFNAPVCSSTSRKKQSHENNEFMVGVSRNFSTKGYTFIPPSGCPDRIIYISAEIFTKSAILSHRGRSTLIPYVEIFLSAALKICGFSTIRLLFLRLYS